MVVKVFVFCCCFSFINYFYEWYKLVDGVLLDYFFFVLLIVCDKFDLRFVVVIG